MNGASGLAMPYLEKITQHGHNMISMGSANYFAQQASDKAFQQTRKLMKYGPSWRVDGLRRAGLNPILAAKGGLGGGGGGNFPAVAPGSGHSVAPQSGTSNARHLINKQRELMEAQRLAALNLGRKHKLEADVVAAGLPRAMAEMAYFLTPEGQETARRTLRTQSDPNDALLLILKRILGSFEGQGEGTMEPDSNAKGILEWLRKHDQVQVDADGNMSDGTKRPTKKPRGKKNPTYHPRYQR